jgi:hypothetical protein
LLDLGDDLSALWTHPDTSNDLKKRILRTVLHEVVVKDDEERREHILHLHWQGGVHTELRVPRNTTGKHRRVTDKTAIDLIRELSKVCSDQTIAATLNRLGYRTGAEKTWRVHSVRTTRHCYQVPNYRHSGQWLTIEQTSKELAVSHTVIHRLIREAILPATQVVASTPWIIERGSLSLPAVQAAIKAVHHGRQLPKVDPKQRSIPFDHNDL